MGEINNKIRGSLIGGAIGDALGYQIEFKRNIKDKEITKYQNDKGIISDDTQMSLFTANALLWRNTRGKLRGIGMPSAGAIYEAYLDWLDTQNNTNNHNSISWIKEIPELNIERAPGNTCLSSLLSGKMGTIEEPINNSKGCGGIMRVAPVGLYAKDPITAGKIGAESSAITHGHSLGILPCYILASMLNMIVYNNETIEVSLDKSIHQYYDEFNKFNKTDVDYFIELINKAKKLSKKNISDVEAISSLGKGWVAEETFAIAIYSCLKYPNSFQDTIVCSVNHDGDSDSTGAIAGNIIGAYLGYDAIPSYYKDNVELKDIILELADDMSIDVPISEYSSNKDEKWENKYVYCKRNKDKTDGMLKNKPKFIYQEPEIQELNSKFNENSKPISIEQPSIYTAPILEEAVKSDELSQGVTNYKEKSIENNQSSLIKYEIKIGYACLLNYEVYEQWERTIDILSNAMGKDLFYLGNSGKQSSIIVAIDKILNDAIVLKLKSVNPDYNINDMIKIEDEYKYNNENDKVLVKVGHKIRIGVPYAYNGRKDEQIIYVQSLNKSKAIEY